MVIKHFGGISTEYFGWIEHLPAFLQRATASPSGEVLPANFGKLVAVRIPGWVRVPGCVSVPGSVIIPGWVWVGEVPGWVGVQ